ncbi:hypothetical protein [Sorangium sp. So ce1099]|uniref:hypothetical protein n=1 Tax=Sorangium sp. So ce1099 TaxID=3133331 RepID=UPI003F5FC45D
MNQFVMGGFEVASKVDGREAYRLFPEQRLHRLKDGQLSGNVIVNSAGKQHRMDTHKVKTFEQRVPNYVIGKNVISLTTPEEVARGRAETIDALSEILQKNGSSPIEIVGRHGTNLNEEQIFQLRAWLSSLKAA